MSNTKLLEVVNEKDTARFIAYNLGVADAEKGFGMSTFRLPVPGQQEEYVRGYNRASIDKLVSEKILDQIIQSFDGDGTTDIVINKLNGYSVGQNTTTKSGFAGVIRAFAIVNRMTYVWVEKTYSRGRAIHKGMKISELV